MVVCDRGPMPAEAAAKARPGLYKKAELAGEVDVLGISRTLADGDRENGFGKELHRRHQVSKEAEDEKKEEEALSHIAVFI